MGCSLVVLGHMKFSCSEEIENVISVSECVVKRRNLQELVDTRLKCIYCMLVLIATPSC